MIKIKKNRKLKELKMEQKKMQEMGNQMENIQIKTIIQYIRRKVMKINQK